MKNLTVHLDDKPIYDIVYEESFDALPSMIKNLATVTVKSVWYTEVM